MARNTGNAEDGEIGEQILDNLLYNLKIINQNVIDRFYQYNAAGRWELNRGKSCNRVNMSYVKEVKSTIRGFHELKEKDGTTYKIKILGRGEGLFFQKNDNALICDISARFAVIDPNSIKRWDNGSKISDEERSLILAKIIDLYKQAYQDDLTVKIK